MAFEVVIFIGEVEVTTARAGADQKVRVELVRAECHRRSFVRLRIQVEGLDVFV